MKRMEFERYWSYYLSIEEMFKKTNQYVSHSNENQKTYSDEFAKIILLSCSEIDSLLKIVCKYKEIPNNGKNYNMVSYSKALIKVEEIHNWAFATSPMTSIKEFGIIVYPFKDLNTCKKHGGLSWWEDYQKLKHNRLSNAEVGNLYNASCSLVAHYMILRIMIDFLDEYSGKLYVIENNHSNFWSPVV